jgi:hypothetical protein
MSVEFEYKPLSYGVLNNTNTNQKHLIVFQDNPRPSDYHSNMGGVRMKSLGHYEGMTPEEWEPVEKAIHESGFRWIGEFIWNGIETPAYIIDRSITPEEAEYLNFSSFTA